MAIITVTVKTASASVAAVSGGWNNSPLAMFTVIGSISPAFFFYRLIQVEKSVIKH